MKKRILALLLLSVMTMSAPLAFAQDGQDAEASANAAVEWVISQQLPEGGWSDGFSEGANPGATADAIFALASAGTDVSTLASTDGNTPLDYLASALADPEAANITSGVAAKIVTALTAVGEDPADFAGGDWVTALLDSQDETGVFVDDVTGVYGHCLVMIALYNAAAAEPEGDIADALTSATEALVGVQNEDGGWGFAVGNPSDTNTTAVCVQALAGLDNETAGAGVGAALEYFGAIQNEDGGWPYQNPSDFGTESDANSTGLVVQALIAADADPDDWNTEAMLDFILSLQNESGSYSFNAAFPGDNFLATIGLIPAFYGYPFTAAYLLPAMNATEAAQ